MSDKLLVMTTLPDRPGAEALAKDLVCQGLAACVNIGAPVTSVYQWQGKVEQATEWPLTIKTTRQRYPAVEQAVVAAHPYELPEVVAVTITEGLTSYLEWIENCSRN